MLKEETGIDTTIFYGDTRVTTTLLDENGKRFLRYEENRRTIKRADEIGEITRATKQVVESLAKIIRNLSEQSREPAEKIIDIVNGLIHNSDSGVITMNEMTKIMDEQNAMIENTSVVFNSLNGEVTNVATAIASIGKQVSFLETSQKLGDDTSKFTLSK